MLKFHPGRTLSPSPITSSTHLLKKTAPLIGHSFPSGVLPGSVQSLERTFLNVGGETTQSFNASHQNQRVYPPNNFEKIILFSPTRPVHATGRQSDSKRLTLYMYVYLYLKLY